MLPLVWFVFCFVFVFVLFSLQGLIENASDRVSVVRDVSCPDAIPIKASDHPPRASFFALQNRFELSGWWCTCPRFSGFGERNNFKNGLLRDGFPSGG
jgi:hypothetical protein